jgi:transposase
VQLLFGVGVTHDGVVVYGNVAGGKTQDMIANGNWITQLRRQLGVDDYDFLLYVADSAAVTEENLKLMRLFHLDILSRLPARFGLRDTLLAQAPSDLEQWEELGVLGQSKKAASYKAWETEAELVGATYRFVVLWSDSLAAQHRRTLKRQLHKEWTGLEKALSEVERQTFEQPSEAQVYWTAWLDQQKLTYHQLAATVEAVEVTLPYPKPGRPPKGATRPTAIYYRLVVTVLCDWQGHRAACQTHGKFILITSLRDRQAYPARAILAEYKEQYTAERAFRFIKDPTWVGAFCLKKPQRIVAFAYVLLMAAMVYTLMERQVRRSLQPADIGPIIGLNNRPTKQPTAYAIKTILTPILVIASFLNGLWSFRPSRPLTHNQKRTLALAGFSERIYYWQGDFISRYYHSVPP